MVSLKRSILQIWVTWASKIALKNLQLYSVKIKGSHAPCDVTRSHSIVYWHNLINRCPAIPHVEWRVDGNLDTMPPF